MASLNTLQMHSFKNWCVCYNILHKYQPVTVCIENSRANKQLHREKTKKTELTVMGEVIDCSWHQRLGER